MLNHKFNTDYSIPIVLIIYLNAGYRKIQVENSITDLNSITKIQILRTILHQANNLQLWHIYHNMCSWIASLIKGLFSLFLSFSFHCDYFYVVLSDLREIFNYVIINYWLYRIWNSRKYNWHKNFLVKKSSLV